MVEGSVGVEAARAPGRLLKRWTDNIGIEEYWEDIEIILRNAAFRQPAEGALRRTPVDLATAQPFGNI